MYVIVGGGMGGGVVKGMLLLVVGWRGSCLFESVVGSFVGS